MADHPNVTPRRALVGIALTAVGGFVDCFSYVSLDHVFTATMSGNTVLIAVDGAAGRSGSAFVHASAVGIFVLGLLLSSVAIELALHRGIRNVLAIALGAETLCLAGLIAWGAPFLTGGNDSPAMASPALYALVGVTAVAMGIQNTSLRMAGVLNVFTTHVTGTLTRLGEQLVDLLLSRGTADRPSKPAQAALSAALWLAFFLGALLASMLLPRWSVRTVLSLPVAVLLAIVAADLVEPFARPRG
jgi:uncharacterized membrane protein YoaK (UPF0700 family)